MAKKIITDEELTLKRQARRRLLGALALTVLVVILLPMVLDREPPAPLQDIELQIPDKDNVGEFVPKMALPSLDTPTSPLQPASAAAIAPLLDAKVPPAQAEAKTEAKPTVASKPAVELVVKPAEVKPAVVKPKIESKPTAKPDNKIHTGFIVQVGAFANVEAAKALQEKLRKQGYPSYTEKTGDKTRVRVGDYASHAEAEKIRRKLEIQGLQPDVVNLN